jgi:serine/threonine-protein kinase
MAWLPMGTAVLGRYTLMGPIGHGGVAVVYQAMDHRRDEQVALKMLAPTLADLPHARDKVHREAAITDRLRHPCVPRVYDVGDARLPDGSWVPYLAMELLTGVVLAGRLVGGPLPWREAVETAARIGDVLAVAHRRGIVHRDLNPANIMLTPAGVKIIDFGVAAQGGPADMAEDVYALGVLLYQMLTGRSPYPSTGPGSLLSPNRFRRMAPTPVLPVPGMPRQVADICRSCMAKRPADRPGASASALALWAALDHPSAGSGASAVTTQSDMTFKVG